MRKVRATFSQEKNNEKSKRKGVIPMKLELIHDQDTFENEELHYLKLIRFALGRATKKINYNTTKNNMHELESMYNKLNEFLNKN